MSWEDQGRQEHGWFRHGTAPPKLDDKDAGDRFARTPETLDQRIRGLGHGAIAAMPRRLRYHHAVHFPGPVMEQLVGAMRAWAGGLSLDRAEFARRYFAASANWPAGEHLREAARIVAGARSPADMMAATDQLAAGIQGVGLDRWRQFLSDSQKRAAASSSAVSASSGSVTSSGHAAPPASRAAPSSLETMFMIDGAYRQRLGRGASAAEIAASRAMLADGASLKDLRAAISVASVFIARRATLVSYVPPGSVTPPVGALVDPYKNATFRCPRCPRTHAGY